MPNYCTPILEFSSDPLSDTTPTWVDVTSYLIEASWFSGKEKDLDEPQAGGATFRLKNTNRRFEPEFAGGAFYPGIRPGRRFRWRIVADGVTYSQQIFYATNWDVQYPAGTTYSEVSVSCADGFWPLSLQTLPALDPPDAASFEDVAAFDGPFAHYPVNETGGRTMTAITGPEGVYKGSPNFGYDSPIVGDSAPGVQFPNNSSAYGRAKLDDTDVFHDANGVTLECTVKRPGGGARTFAAGPFDTIAGGPSFELNAVGAVVFTPLGSLDVSWLGGTIGAGTTHLALTFDGSSISAYKNGVFQGATQLSGDVISPDANEFLYVGEVGNHSGVGSNDDVVGNVVFYTYALSADRILAHANAALNRGYDAQLAGDRIDTLATNPLWSTAGIPSGQITAGPRMQTGQSVLDEITQTVKAETPVGLFYFNDAGNPIYRPWDEAITITANFGDLTSETQYDSLQLIYDDEVFNQSTVSREGGLAQTAIDATSSAEFGTRTQDETGLIIDKDSDAALISQTIVDRFANPQFRVASIDLNGADIDARTQILTREVGDYIRIKRRGEGGTPIDIITRILGKSKTLSVERDLRCTWRLSRGFNAATQVNHLGVPGYSELGANFILA